MQVFRKASIHSLSKCSRNEASSNSTLTKPTQLQKTLAGRNVVVVTPTASGKTLCYNIPVLNTLLTHPDARALYLFPTKALAQDQMEELYQLIQLTGRDLKTFTYDGDTPQDARRAIRAQGHVVVSNPDMLHAGILPHHTKWVQLFENLKYVVIDELHSYRGVFGSHLTNVLRRLKRICAFYGSKPQFICCSATIANPKELAAKLLEEDVELVDNNGAPRGEKYFVFYNPPVVNQQLGIRRSYVNETRSVALSFLKRGLQTLVFANSRLVTEILVTYLKDALERNVLSRDLVRGYRGGYLPLERREVEKGLREGKILGVVATNALELGVDIGSLEVCVMAGYSGSIASTWQRAGRAGRRSGVSAAVLVASSAPLDQFIVEHPEYFFGQSPEHGLINPDNLEILLNHVKCAVFELPFTDGEKFGGVETRDILKFLEENGFVHAAGGQWHWTSEAYPADVVSLRSVSSDNFVVLDVTGEPKIISKVDFPSALTTVHEKAIYIHEGQQYFVEKLDYKERRAHVKRVDLDYFTDAISYTQVRILDTFESQPLKNSVKQSGEIHLTTQVVGFKKIKFYTLENVGAGDLELPEQEMHTTSYWLTLPKGTDGFPALSSVGPAEWCPRPGSSHATDGGALPDVRPARYWGDHRRESGGRDIGPGSQASPTRVGIFPARSSSRTFSSTTTIPAASDSASLCMTCMTVCCRRQPGSFGAVPARKAVPVVSAHAAKRAISANRWRWRFWERFCSRDQMKTLNREGAKSAKIFSRRRHSGQAQREPESSCALKCSDGLDSRVRGND